MRSIGCDLADNTVVVVTADHGERGGAHGGMLGKGADIYKETLRVPLIVRHPDVRGGDSPTRSRAAWTCADPARHRGLDDAERVQRYPDLHGVDLRAAIATRARGPRATSAASCSTTARRAAR